MIGGGNGANIYLLGSPILALASHTDVISNSTYQMSYAPASLITGTSMVSIVEN